jgi:ketosteroid isomerase-like protein
MSPETYLRRKDVARANRDFYQALEQLDIERMRALWLDDPTVKCVHPGGELIVGAERIMESWRLIFENTKNLRFEVMDLQLEVVGDMAWANHVELLHVQRTSGGPEQVVLLSESAATNLFVRRDEGWKMVLHHASPIARRFFDG